MVYRTFLAFVKRDFANAISYRFAFTFQFFGVFLSILSFYFIDKMFGEVFISYLQPYGGDYFAFVLIGLAFSSYQGVGLGSFSTAIRYEQVTGTLEVMLVTPTKMSTILISSSLWKFINTSINVLVYLLLGAFLFGVNFKDANILAAVLILVLAIIAFSSFGILSASFIMVFKQGSPVNWLFGSFSTLLGGVMYPITVLPGWLQIFSYFLPITYALRALRHALLLGYSLEALAFDIIVLTLFSIIMLPLGMISFNYAVRRAKMDGSLTKY